MCFLPLRRFVETATMPPLIECVPNFSEGRNPAVVRALSAAITSVPGIRLLHRSMDFDHHRSVLTFVGSPEAVGDAALRAIATATELIDLRRHEGGHPRIGATDVVPFIPIRDIGMDECVRLARMVGEAVGRRLAIPVFLYEQAASRPERRRLEAIRHGGLKGLASRMEQDPTWRPDFGPPHLHETAGATVIGARHLLIAFNVNLRTTDLSIANDIARSIRESNGGLPCLKAIGVRLASRSMVQVAMNLTDYRVTPPHQALRAVTIAAEARGTEIAGTELIGLVPQAALDLAAAASLRLERFDPTQILETSLASEEGQDRDQTLPEFLNAVAAARPAPGGGSVAALVGALGTSLGIMGARLGGHTNEERDLLQVQLRLRQLVQADSESYGTLVEAYQMPKDNPDRPRAINIAIHRAIEIPLDIAESACEAGRLLDSIRRSAKPLLFSDLTVGMHMALAAAIAGLLTAKTNIKHQEYSQLSDSLLSRTAKIERSLEELRELCYTPPPGL